MAGPFPGMDPRIEFQSGWPDFHNRLVAAICEELGGRLPDSYVARVDERIEVIFPQPISPSTFRPDIVLASDPLPSPSPFRARSGTSSVIEPRILEVIDRDPDELRLTWVEIRALPHLQLVTAIEVLSLVDKAHPGRRPYLEKRDQLHEARVNLVEIDLLLAGAPLPMKQPITPGGYCAIVARGARLPKAEVYCWTVRDPIPSIPIPLRDPDPDILVDLGALVARVYDLGRYVKTLRPDNSIPDNVTLHPDDRAWITATAAIEPS